MLSLKSFWEVLFSPKGQSHLTGRGVHGQKGFDAACAQRSLHKRCSGPLTQKVAEYKKSLKMPSMEMAGIVNRRILWQRCSVVDSKEILCCCLFLISSLLNDFYQLL